MKLIFLILTTISFQMVFAGGPVNKSDKKYFDEIYRPQFHFSAEKGILSTPVGQFFYKGEYHLFYVYQPDTSAMSSTQWGHAVSRDLIKWENLPVFNLEGSANNQCPPLLGSAVIDEKNITGLQQGEEKTILLFYTARECGQCLAYSNDKGRTWKKYANTLQIAPEKDNPNGPKVIFDPGSGKWIMTIYRCPDGEISNQGISFYTSNDLLHWNFQSHIEGFSGNADLFSLNLEGETKWVLSGSNNEYLIGKFDGKSFTPETSKRKIDAGKNFQAAHSWTDLPDGKIIQMAWMRGGKFPDMPFIGQMSFPCELSIKKSSSGVFLCRKPINGLENFFDKDLKKKEKNLIPGLKGNLVGPINGDVLLIKGIFDPKTSDAFGFYIRNGKKSQGAVLKYEPAKKILECLSRQAFVDTNNGKLELEVLVDRTSIEVFANGGETTMSSCFLADEGENNLVLWTQGGELFVDQLEVYTIKSVWDEKKK
jgi:sucrose-6-phosphate hydrolase SacC (GH32 family)